MGDRREPSKGGHSRRLLPGDVWVTFQIHLNVMTIASMKEIAAIILVCGRRPDEETLQKAVAEKIPVLGTTMSAFQVVGELYQLGIRPHDACV